MPSHLEHTELGGAAEADGQLAPSIRVARSSSPSNASTARRRVYIARVAVSVPGCGTNICYRRAVGRPLTTQLDDPDGRPYFLWDEDTSSAQLREVFRGPSGAERDRLLGKMLREARDLDVWQFVSPADVAEALPRLRRRLGRRYEFWRWLIEGWRQDGLLQ
jgi:hypothetical protein